MDFVTKGASADPIHEAGAHREVRAEAEATVGTETEAPAEAKVAVLRLEEARKYVNLWL